MDQIAKTILEDLKGFHQFGGGRRILIQFSEENLVQLRGDVTQVAEQIVFLRTGIAAVIALQRNTDIPEGQGDLGPVRLGIGIQLGELLCSGEQLDGFFANVLRGSIESVPWSYGYAWPVPKRVIW